MTTEKMTVHEALCELKTLDARIEKAIRSGPFVFANKHANNKVSGLPVGAYCDEIRQRYQSVKDLIARRDAIKRAVVLSNASTTVVIGDRSYTVAEAIEMKNHGVPMLQRLLERLNEDNRVARRTADSCNGDSLEGRADEYVKSLYGNVDMKGASDEIKKIRTDFIAAQTTEVIDPIGVVAKMENLSERIDGFTVKIDSALSVSNALTEITIEY